MGSSISSRSPKSQPRSLPLLTMQRRLGPTISDHFISFATPEDPEEWRNEIAKTGSLAWNQQTKSFMKFLIIAIYNKNKDLLRSTNKNHPKKGSFQRLNPGVAGCCENSRSIGHHHQRHWGYGTKKVGEEMNRKFFFWGGWVRYNNTSTPVFSNLKYFVFVCLVGWFLLVPWVDNMII